MIRLLIAFLLSLSFLQIAAQEDVFSKLPEIRKLLYEPTIFNTGEALSRLNLIEEECTKYENDTLSAVYSSLKGQTLFSLQKYKECIPYCKETIRLCEQCNLRQYEYLDAFKVLGEAYHRLHDYSNAEAFYRKGLIRSVSANVSTSSQYKAELYLNLGRVLEVKGDSTLAVECFQRCRQLQEQEPFDVEKLNYIEWENSCWDKIDLLSKSGKYQEAVDEYATLIDGILKNLGYGGKYILAVYSKALLLSRYLNRFEDALPLFIDAAECARQLNIHSESACGAYCNICQCYAYLGKTDKLDGFVPVAKSFLTMVKNDDYPVHSLYRFIGNGAYWRQNYDVAIKYYELYLLPGNKREDGSSYDDITNQLSVSYILAGKPRKAIGLLTMYLDEAEKRLKAGNPAILANVYHNLGRAYMLQGATKEALAFLNKSVELQKRIYGEVSERTQLYINECASK